MTNAEEDEIATDLIEAIDATYKSTDIPHLVKVPIITALFTFAWMAEYMPQELAMALAGCKERMDQLRPKSTKH